MGRTQFDPGGPQTQPPVSRSEERRVFQARGAQKIRGVHSAGVEGEPLGTRADVGPKIITAGKVKPGMVISAIPTEKHPRPRKFTVRTIGISDDVLEVDGKKVRVRRIFFNGKGGRKYYRADKLALHFAPDPVRDGKAVSGPRRPDLVTSDEEKEANRRRREAEKEALRKLMGE